MNLALVLGDENARSKLPVEHLGCFGVDQVAIIVEKLRRMWVFRGEICGQIDQFAPDLGGFLIVYVVIGVNQADFLRFAPINVTERRG